jgi:hypothetical protein
MLDEWFLEEVLGVDVRQFLEKLGSNDENVVFLA